MSQNKNQKGQLNNHVITAFVSIMVSLITTYFLFGGNHNNFPTIKTVDLNRIHRAQMMLTMRATQLPNDESKRWIDKVNTASLQIKKVITELAGNGAVVIVSPAVISGAMDITDDVLKKLGLPTDVPVTQAPRGLVLGNNANELMSENKSNSANQALTVKQKAQSALDFLTQ